MEHLEILTKYEKLVAVIGTESILEQLIKAMDDDAIRENLEFIARMNDIDFDGL